MHGVQCIRISLTILLHIVLSLDESRWVRALWQVIPVHTDVVRHRDATFLHTLTTFDPTLTRLDESAHSRSCQELILIMNMSRAGRAHLKGSIDFSPVQQYILHDHVIDEVGFPQRRIFLCLQRQNQ